MTPPTYVTRHRPVLVAAAILAAVQAVAAVVIGGGHLLANHSLSPVPPIGLTAVVPVALFLLAYAFSARVRAAVLALDLKVLTRVQLWRIIGFTFLPLYFYGVLPGLFAYPAGLGDVAVGLMAFVVLLRLDRDPDYATSAGYVRFHVLGLLDFAVAMGSAGLASGFIPALVPGGVTSAAMDVWPLNLFPSFIVPAFIILQVSALLKVRHLRRLSRTPDQAVPLAA